jgi:predicted alpha/beta superfamily hydrolase
MKKNILFILLIFNALQLVAQLTIKIKTIPTNTPAGDKIYMAGNINNWSPSDTSKIFKLQTDGSYSLTFTPSVSALEFKFTRGAWTSVEGSAQGGFVPNRTLAYNGTAQTVELNIAGWEGQSTQTSTAAANVKVISTNFKIPQLNRERKVWIYLPPDYNKDTTKRYPVFYMHDGQNLFDKTTSFAGEWEVDESLNKLFDAGDKGCIVVGIDNGGANRLNEYSPWRNAQYGGGEGKAYTNFLVETLKPYIDLNFRTKKDRENTAIGGSSMGGLISMYALMEHQEMFSKAAIFSPAFWFALDSCLNHPVMKGKQFPIKIYFTAGTTESTSMVPDINKMEKMMLGIGFKANEYKIVPKTDGQHAEWFWAREYPSAYKWLFAENTTNTVEERNLEAGEKGVDISSKINIYPNPSDSVLNIETQEILNYVNIEIYDIYGRLMHITPYIQGKPIDTKFLSAGSFIVKGVKGQQTIFTKKIVKR